MQVDKPWPTRQSVLERQRGFVVALSDTLAKHRMLLFGRAFVLARNAVADKVTQRIHRRVCDAVVHAGAPAFALDKALLCHQAQVARDVGCRVAAQLGQLAHVALAFTQKVQDAQARGLRQRLKVRGNLRDGFWGQVLHGKFAGGQGHSIG